MIPGHRPRSWFTSNRGKLRRSQPAAGSAGPVDLLRGESDKDDA